MQKEVIIDVRELDEFEAEHIPCSIHLPLGQFLEKIEQTTSQIPSESKILIMCRSDKRAELAMNQLSKLNPDIAARTSVYIGGILKWKSLNLPTVIKKENHFPIMRQVQLIAGLLVLISSFLVYLNFSGFLFLSAFIGLGLTFAGLTGFCGMAKLLALAPWNRISKECD